MHGSPPTLFCQVSMFVRWQRGSPCHPTGMHDASQAYMLCGVGCLLPCEGRPVRLCNSSAWAAGQPSQGWMGGMKAGNRRGPCESSGVMLQA